MARHRIRRYAIGFTTLLTLSVMLSAVAFSPAYAVTPTPHSANAMWIQPAVINFDSSTTVGTKFNVTIWLNVTSNTNSWEMFLVYNRKFIQALRCDYSGVGKSLWSGSSSITAVPPDIQKKPGNSTYSYVVAGEVLNNNLEKTGANSLEWIEFNVTYVPPQGVSNSTELLLDQDSLFRSYCMDASYSDIVPVLTLYNCDYFIPEFPLTALLVAFFVVTASIALIVRRIPRQKMNIRHSCRL